MGKFTPIAMRCTQEQFDTIAPILKQNDIDITNIYDRNRQGFIAFPYLVNNYFGRENNISNISTNDRISHNRIVFETWNIHTFLEACGLERVTARITPTIPTYEVDPKIDKLAHRAKNVLYYNGFLGLVFIAGKIIEREKFELAGNLMMIFFCSIAVISALILMYCIFKVTSSRIKQIKAEYNGKSNKTS